MLDGRWRIVSDQIKSSTYKKNKTQPFSTVHSWGQSGPPCLRTLYYNLVPLMQPSFPESESTFFPLFIHVHPHIHKGLKRDSLRILRQNLPFLQNRSRNTVCGVFNGLMGDAVAQGLALKHRRIHWGSRADYVRVEIQLLIDDIVGLWFRYCFCRDRNITWYFIWLKYCNNCWFHLFHFILFIFYWHSCLQRRGPD